MNEKTIVICKSITFTISFAIWSYLLVTLILIGPPIWGVLQILLSTILGLIYIVKTKKNKKLITKIDNLEKRIKILEEGR